jgi:hypothetical protein
MRGRIRAVLATVTAALIFGHIITKIIGEAALAAVQNG